MRYLIFILIVVASFGASAQIRYPTGFPTQYNQGYNRWGYTQSDSGLIVANRDTNWLAKFSGTVVFKPSNKKFYWFDSTNLSWNVFASTIDTTSLSNRINLKLNISDTVGKWLAQSSRLVDTMYRVNDSTIGYTIKGSPYTFQILGRSSSGGGGAGTVTSVGLSLPSAFNVTPSTITTSGVFNVTGAGTTAQLIRGNGTLITSDTGIIPNFYLKVRGLLSGTSPITFNQTTGAIGINNANTTGTKGAASFTSAFSDNGSGLIDLANIVSTGSCTNCSVTYNAKGQATAYSSGIAPSGSSVDTIFRTPGVDSIYYTINSVQYAIKDSTNPIITANNGLTKTSNNIQWGGALVQSTAVDGGASFISTFTATGGLTLRALNTSNGNAFYANTTGSGAAVTAQANTGNGLAASSVTQYGVSAVSTSNLGLYASTTSGISAGAFEVNPSSTNTSQTILQLKRYSSGTAANGIAGRIEFITEPSAGTGDVTSGYIENGWEDATFATRKSYLSWWTTLNGTTARKANLSSTGQWTWDGYPTLTAQTDTTTYKPLAINGSGNVVKMIGWAGSGGGGSTPTLQAVTDVGNATTNDIIIGSRTSSVGRFSVEKTFTALNVHSFDDYSTLNPSSGGNGFASFDASTNMIGSVNNDHYIGYQSRLIYNAAGNLTGDYGMTGLYVYNLATGAGTITNAHGIYIRSVGSGGTPITNAYGVRILPVTVGTNNFGIRSEGGKNSFVDEVMIGGHTTPIAKLDVRSSTWDQTLYCDNTKANGYGGIFNASNGSGGNIGLDITASGGTGNKGVNFGGAMTANDWNIYSSGASKAYIAGKVGVGSGITSPTALIHLAAGTATANTAPLKFTSGTNLTTPEDGAIEYNGTHYYGTIGSTRYQLDQQGGSGITTLNTLTAATQTFATGTSGSDFGISSSSSTHTFNLPNAGTSTRGVVSIIGQTFHGQKTFENGVIIPYLTSGALVINTDVSASVAPGISGIGLALQTYTYTDNGLARTESNAQNLNLIGAPVITSSNAITYSDNSSTVRITGAPIASGSMTLSHPWALYANDVNFVQTLAIGINEQSSSATLGNGSMVVYTGTGGHTFTLPSLATHPGKVYFIKNAGSASVTISRGGSDNIYDTSSVTSITIAAGAARVIIAGSSFWYVQ